MKTGTLRRELNHLPTSSTARRWQLLFLLSVLGSQICISRCQASTSASGDTCTPECGIGYRCKVVNGEPRCEEKSCNRNCTGKPEAQVCGTNGVTYRNRCELKKARCQLAVEINVTYSGPCITLPPPPEHLCRALQRDIDNADMLEYQRRCNYMDLQQKGRDGTLTLIDLLPCYRPQCTNDAFAARQCSINVDGWCWCSTADGRAIQETFQYNLPAGTCDRRQSCDYEGKTRKDGDLFTTEDGCGFCECLDGQVACFQDYVPDSSGKLNTSQQNLLKEEIMQVFYFQYNHDEHVLINIRHIHQHPTTVPDTLKERILLWKFHHYDRNGDNVLFPAEEFIFQLELYEFVRCKAFFDHVSDLVDEDNDGQITHREWTNFFLDDTSSSTTSGLGSSSTSGSVSSPGTQPSKRSASPVLRKPLERRNKFFYVLF